MTSTTKPAPSAKVSDVISSFQPTRRFGPSPNQKPYSITSIDFDDTGELCLVAQDDETLQIYNCKEGKHAKELKSQKYGVDLARFTHHSQSIIYASTKGDDAIRYLSSHDNSYIRYFRGHTGAVSCIALSPSSDEFISASLDNTVRLWDLRSQSPQGQLNLNSPYLCAYDPTATVLAIACPAAQSVLLYDVRNYDKSPFATFDLRPIEESVAAALGLSNKLSREGTLGEWTKLEFSNDGKRMMVATNGPGHFLLDAFEGKLESFCVQSQGPTNRVAPRELAALRERQRSRSSMVDGRTSSQGAACMSPDGRYVIGGAGDNGLYAWDAHAAPPDKMMKPTYDLSSKTAGMAAVVAYNPRHNLLCTADRALVLWLPDMET